MSDAVRKTEEYIRKTGMLSGDGHVIMGVSGSSRPDIECIFVVSRASSKVRGGSIDGIRLASMLFPLPGAPMSSAL